MLSLFPPFFYTLVSLVSVAISSTTWILYTWPYESPVPTEQKHTKTKQLASRYVKWAAWNQMKVKYSITGRMSIETMCTQNTKELQITRFPTMIKERNKRIFSTSKMINFNWNKKSMTITPANQETLVGIVVVLNNNQFLDTEKKKWCAFDIFLFVNSSRVCCQSASYSISG